MPRLLVVEASPRGKSAISRNLTAAFVEKWRAKHPDGTVVARDLTTTDLPFVNASWLAAYFTPSERHSPEMRETLRLSDALVAELLAADHIVIGTPVYNYNIPANLKAWVDHIVRKGHTLGFGGEGLVTGKRATVLVASGGVYTEGSPIRDRDVATHYLKLILNVIGIDDVSVIAAGGAKAVDLGEISRDDFLAPLRTQIDIRLGR
ncbi:NAD(P)H-dependent oxidoreductase [Nguyenibacter sp. L1]|uniref:FMN-dependent NADH-azoreductase n=1 Tax=Nguyenibacter sp. L1 TaxID=3049350 RepID=UPI002B4AAD56|nr:NAD(P)H-dependent oxidoreductase [Nguyenibacter sp. L1]WRH89109.1 NAD(P)H-dependent oxidoreductase [Nguyenibacter sp. L1]